MSKGSDVTHRGPIQDGPRTTHRFWTSLLLFLLWGAAFTSPAPAQAPAGFARIHYFRPDGNYTGWAVYSWSASTSTNTYCSGEVQKTGSDGFGAYFDIPINPSAGWPKRQLGFIINNCATGTKDPGPDQFLQTTTYTQGWVISGSATVHTSQPTPGQIASSGLHNLQAIWIDRNTVAIPASAGAQRGWTAVLLRLGKERQKNVSVLFRYVIRSKDLQGGGKVDHLGDGGRFFQ